MGEYEERELLISKDQPVKAWRVFDLVMDGDTVAVSRHRCSRRLGRGHESRLPPVAQAAPPASNCRCGVYGVVAGQNEPLTGYPRGVVFAEVALSGRAFVDFRAVRAERGEILRLVAPDVLLLQGLGPNEPRQLLEERYGVMVESLDAAPAWVADTSYRDLRQRVDLDSLSL